MFINSEQLVKIKPIFCKNFIQAIESIKDWTYLHIFDNFLALYANCWCDKRDYNNTYHANIDKPLYLLFFSVYSNKIYLLSDKYPLSEFIKWYIANS